jgi:outer membrane protein assembly factor BamB
VKRTLPAVALVLLAVPAHADWPQWRGPQGFGVSPERNLPVSWAADRNVAWKTALPDRSGATPIVSGDRIFLNVAEGESLSLWALDRRTGAVVWKRPLGGGNETKRKHNMSSPSPATDGAWVFVLTGTGVLKAFDFEGNEKWGRDLQGEYGPFGLNWGYGSSPLLFEDSLFVQVLHGMKTEDPSYLLRIDKKTGQNRWRVERPTPAIRESPDAYTTPVLARHGDALELVVTGGDVITGHDPQTGRELWRATGLNPDNDPWYRIVASPLVVGELVIAPTRVKPMLAVRSGGRGDVTRTHRVWSFDHGPDVPTPVSDGAYLYVVGDKGIVWCLDVKTGQPVYGPERLRAGTYSASPVLADGKVYVTSEEGVTSVFKAGAKFELLAENVVDGFTLSTLAVSGGQIFLRTAEYLYCIGEPAAR